MTTKEEEQLNSESEPEPRLIGLTGGIGSGKTTVAKYIEELGYSVYNSDTVAKNIVNKNPTLKAKIKNLLGEEAYKNEVYDTKYVSEKVFGNDELLLQLNQIIHPAVKDDFEEWVKKQKGEFIFKETALLFELKLNEQCYKSILVTAEDNIRIKRVMDRDNKTYREVENVIKKQLPEKNKIKLANFVIFNNSNLESLKNETEKMIEGLRANHF